MIESEMRDVLDLISRKYKDKLSPDSLASAGGMSMSVFYRKFKLATGFSPAEYIRHFRLQRAFALVCGTTALSVKQICFSVGFGDFSHFLRDFKRTYGLTPRNVRRQLLFPVSDNYFSLPATITPLAMQHAFPTLVLTGAEDRGAPG